MDPQVEAIIQGDMIKSTYPESAFSFIKCTALERTNTEL